MYPLVVSLLNQFSCFVALVVTRMDGSEKQSYEESRGSSNDLSQGTANDQFRPFATLTKGAFERPCR